MVLQTSERCVEVLGSPRSIEKKKFLCRQLKTLVELLLDRQ